MPLDAETARAVAILEIRALGTAGASIGRFEVGDVPTPFHDLRGDVLFLRFRLLRHGRPVGHADVGVLPDLGGPLLAVAPRSSWDPDAAHDRALRVAGRSGSDRGTPRWVAYGYPKIGILLDDDDDATLFDVGTWVPVPPVELDVPLFRRWSLLESFSPARRRENEGRWHSRVASWSEYLEHGTPDAPAGAPLVDAVTVPGPDVPWFGQDATVWCVAACAQMTLGYHRIRCTQLHLAQVLGLFDAYGLPKGLPADPAAVGTVSQLLIDFSTGPGACLDERPEPYPIDSAVLDEPTWEGLTDILDGTTTVIEFIPAHARVAVGYSSNSISGGASARSLRVYDPAFGPGSMWVSADVVLAQYACTAQGGPPADI